ncbi:unnamed protein product [Durusdinium trenchii]|uniref:Uncharacterized protein n=1 Tax=Durusdinium trenchii TaxID=1381693 RepID=A0ABP0S649_9DINO
MGATAALAFISARSESELEEELEADTQEMLREYALQENQRTGVCHRRWSKYLPLDKMFASSLLDKMLVGGGPY